MAVRSSPGWSARLTGSIRQEMPGILASSIKLVEDEAKRLVYLGHPDHLERQTGALQSSITTEISTENGVVAASVGSSVVYAPVHEFGAAIADPRGFVRVIPPRPFLQPAFSARKEEVRDTVAGGLRAVIREQAI